jgi:filamentous hemagglutinin family protein
MSLPPSRQSCLSILIVLGVASSFALAAGGIATDGSAGPAQTLAGAQITIPQSLGATAGSNLFHSFSHFNIDTGQTVTFTGADSLQNVISRVTGGEASSLDGLLKSEAGHADFYLINPAGITFGAHAQVDVPAAFHASTASQLKLKDGAVFSAANPAASSFSNAAPAAFGFVGNAVANNGLIEADGARLAVKDGQTLDIVAGEIQIKHGAQLNAAAGEIRLIAQQGPSAISLERAAQGHLPLPALAPSNAHAGPITITDSEVLSSGNGAGRIGLWGGALRVVGSHIGADNIGSLNAMPAAGIELRSVSLALLNGIISSNASAQGNAGRVSVATGGKLTVDSQGNPRFAAGIFSDAEVGSTGDAGSVSVDARGDVAVLNGGEIESSAYAQGRAGTVHLATTGQLTVDSQGNSRFATGIFSDAEAGSTGDAGSVSVEVQGHAAVLNGGQIESSTYAQGQAGSVSLTTGGRLTVDSQGHLNFATGIFSDADPGSTGDAGRVKITAQGDVAVLNGGEIESSTYAQGKAGTVIVQTKGKLIVDGTGSTDITGIFSDAKTQSVGDAGSVGVEAKGNVILRNGGEIESSTYAQGQAGTVRLTTQGRLIADGLGNTNFSTGIFSDAERGSAGDSGSVSVNAQGDIQMLNGAIISSDTYAQGKAGTVNVVTSGKLTVDGQGNPNLLTGIFSQANLGSAGDAGRVSVRAKRNITLTSGGEIESSAFAQGRAGIVNVATQGNLRVDGRGSANTTGIFSTAEANSLGDAGSVAVRAGGDVILARGGEISSSAFAQGKGGNVAVAARNVFLSKRAFIGALAGPESSGRTGNISLNLSGNLSLAGASQINVANGAKVLDPARIAPGDVSLSARGILLTDSQITSQSTGNINAGKITIHCAESMALRHAFISTAARLGQGGKISISGDARLTLQNSAITTSVAAGNGNGGDISVQADSLILQTGKIEANAHSGNGGAIQLAVHAFLASSNTLNGVVLGAGNPFAAGVARQFWAPSQAGNNIIQAASSNGVSGAIHLSAPQLNLSGALANLGGPQFDSSRLEQGYCERVESSSLSIQGRGGLPRRSRELILY